MLLISKTFLLSAAMVYFTVSMLALIIGLRWFGGSVVWEFIMQHKSQSAFFIIFICMASAFSLCGLIALVGGDGGELEGWDIAEKVKEE